MSAPIPYIVALAIVAGIIWAIVNWSYSAVLASKDAEIQLLERQRDDYKDKLGGATPDEAKARIDRLEAQVKAISPRRLSDDQKTRLASALRRLPGNIEIAQDMAAPDARPFAGDLIVAFQSAGWQVQTPAVLGPGNPPPHGIGLIVSDPSSLTAHQALIVEGLNAAGVQFDLQRGPPALQLPNIAGVTFPPTPDARIIITQKVL